MAITCKITIRQADNEDRTEFHIRYTFSPDAELDISKGAYQRYNDGPVDIISGLLEGPGLLRIDILECPVLEADGTLRGGTHQRRKLKNGDVRKTKDGNLWDYIEGHFIRRYTNLEIGKKK